LALRAAALITPLTAGTAGDSELKTSAILEKINLQFILPVIVKRLIYN
jgi:hypothetical protein